MFYFILMAVGLAISVTTPIIAAHATVKALEKWREKNQKSDDRFALDSKYARLFHSKPKRMRHA